MKLPSAAIALLETEILAATSLPSYASTSTVALASAFVLAPFWSTMLNFTVAVSWIVEETFTSVLSALIPVTFLASVTVTVIYVTKLPLVTLTSAVPVFNGYKTPFSVTAKVFTSNEVNLNPLVTSALLLFLALTNNCLFVSLKEIVLTTSFLKASVAVNVWSWIVQEVTEPTVAFEAKILACALLISVLFPNVSYFVYEIVTKAASPSLAR